MSDEVAGTRAPCPHCGEDHPAATLKCPKTDLVLPLAGRVLAGRFQLEREIGRGGMASVWLALNTAVERKVALKLIRPEVVKRTETVARFRSEARAAGRIDHPNICQILDFGSSPIGPYMVMEYLRGCSLAALLAGGKTLSVGVATGLVREALSGLAAAHREGIVHRDLKPENVFVHIPVSGPAHVKLMDFGVSKLTDGSGEIQTEHGALLGTPEYMAPEQVGTAANVDERCDLWAVGAMLYRALTGKLPFKGPTIAATLLELTSSEPRAIQSLAPHVPEALCALIMACLAKDRAERPSDADHLAQALQPWAQTVDLAALVAGHAAGIDPSVHGQPDPANGPGLGDGDDHRDDDPGAEGTVPIVPAAKPPSRGWVWPVVGIGAVLAVVWTLNRDDAAVRAPADAGTARLAENPATDREAAGPATVETEAGATVGEPAATGEVGPLGGGTDEATRGGTGTGEDLMIIVEADDDPDKPRPHRSGSSVPRGNAEPEPEPTRDPSGTVRVGDYLVLARAGPTTTHSLAKKYCRGLASAAHVGVTGWKLPNPAVARRLARSKKIRAGRYWTSARHKGNARTLVLPRGELVPEVVDKKRVKALCVASVPRSDKGG